jgi:hypothetical protein
MLEKIDRYLDAGAIRRRPPANPAIAPATLLEVIMSEDLTMPLSRTFSIIFLAAVFSVRRSLYGYETLYPPQYVLPKVNHCMPDVMAKSAGVEDLNIPATPPNKSPHMPASNDVSHWYPPNDHMYNTID